MDLRLSPEQVELQQALHTLFERHAGPGRARAQADTLDRELLERLDEQEFLDIAADEDASLVDAVLLVEQAELGYARAPIAARAIVAPPVLSDPPPAIGLVAGPGSLVRYAGLCDTYLFLEDDKAYRADAGDVDVELTPSRWGYPLGRVQATKRELLDPQVPGGLRRLWQIALAAEMGAQMQRAVTLTARYVTDRRQFGKPIGAYQAVSHQLATAAVFAEGTTWMARRAAAGADPALAAAAAAYGCEAARTVMEATHQVTGAIGIAREYDLVLSTMRLGVLRTELGGAAFHAKTAARERWLSPA